MRYNPPDIATLVFGTEEVGIIYRSQSWGGGEVDGVANVISEKVSGAHSRLYLSRFW